MNSHRSSGGWGAVVLFALAAGCRPLPVRIDPTAREARPIVGRPAVFSVDWWLGLVSAPIMEYIPREMASPGVDPDSGEVVVSTRDHMVRGISADGRIDWSFKTSNEFAAGATIDHGIAYVPGGDGTLYALESRSGQLIWRYEAGDELITTPTVERDTVLVGSVADTIFALSRQTGSLLWRFRRENRNPVEFTIRGASTPRVQAGLVYVGFSNGSIVALGLEDGSVKWDRMLSTPGKQFTDVDTTPVFDTSGHLFAASYPDGIFSLDASTGDVQWHTARAGVTSLLWKEGILFASGDQQVSALLGETGRTLWTLNLGNRAGRAPILAQRFLLVPTNAALLAVDPLNGKTWLSWNPGKGVSATPQWVGSHLYVLSNLGYLYALSLEGSGSK